MGITWRKAKLETGRWVRRLLWLYRHKVMTSWVRVLSLGGGWIWKRKLTGPNYGIQIRHSHASPFTVTQGGKETKVTLLYQLHSSVSIPKWVWGDVLCIKLIVVGKELNHREYTFLALSSCSNFWLLAIFKILIKMLHFYRLETPNSSNVPGQQHQGHLLYGMWDMLQILVNLALFYGCQPSPWFAIWLTH